MYKKVIVLVLVFGLLFSSTGTVFATNSKTGKNSVNWKTNTVSMSADDFYISIDGKKFVPQKATIHSDPGDHQYTTLEVTWFQNGIEMRLYLYLKADSKKYWVSEARIYNGKKKADWIIFNDELFKTTLWEESNYNTLSINQETSDYKVEIHFENVKLEVNFKYENKVPICTEIFLKKGTIIRSSNIAFLTKNKKNTDPKYTTLYKGENQIIFLTKDTQVYLTNGGFYTYNISIEKYIEKISSIGIKVNNISIY